MRSKAGLILLISIASLAAYFIASSFLSPKLVLEEKKAPTITGQVVIQTEAEGDAFHLGDIISYKVNVFYRSDRKIEINKKHLDHSIIFEPFEVVGAKERDCAIDSKTRMYQKEYKIQLVEGLANQIYSFPPFIVRFRADNSPWLDREVIPQPIFISPRVPEGNLSVFWYKPTKGTVQNISYDRLPKILWGLGAVLVACWILKKMKSRKWEKETPGVDWGELKELHEAYQTLAGKEPKSVFHQVHQILRTILTVKEGIDWLNPDYDGIPEKIKGKALNLLRESEKAYCQESPTETEEVLKELGDVFDFYTKGEGEV